MIFLTIILIYNYYQIVVKCSRTSNEINTKGITAYANIIKNIVQNPSNITDNLINTKEKFHIGLNRIQIIHEEFYNIVNNYDGIDIMNVLFHFEDLDNNLEDRYKKMAIYFFDIMVNDVNEELYKKLSTEYSEKNHQDLKMIREQKLPNINPEENVVFSKKVYKNICDYNYSLVKANFHIYQQLIMLELKSFLTDTFIYLLYSYCHFGLNKSKEHDDLMFNNYNNLMEQLQINLDSYQNIILKYAKSFSANDLYGCTSGPVGEDEIVEYEWEDFQTLIDKSNCSYENCEFPIFQRDETYRFQLGKYHSNKLCYGTLMDCSPVETVEFCYASDSSSKRYEGLKLNDEIHGNLTWCPKGKHTISSDPWSIKKCDVCVCNCPAYSPIRDTYELHGKISFMEETSDISNNSVVTDVKFVEMNNTVYMQIEEGQLSMVKLNVGNNGKTWKPLNEPWSVMEISQEYKSNKYGQIIYGNNISYGEIYINTSILYLDDIILPFGHVVTGVKFGFKMNETKSIIQIQVRATPYDLITNELIVTDKGKPTSFWITAESMDSSKMPEYQRKRTALTDIKTDSVPNQSILFQSPHSRNDSQQTIIPYFDPRMIYSKWPFPLRGIGISIKAYNDTQQFITLKTFPYTIPTIV